MFKFKLVYMYDKNNKGSKVEMHLNKGEKVTLGVWSTEWNENTKTLGKQRVGGGWGRRFTPP